LRFEYIVTYGCVGFEDIVFALVPLISYVCNINISAEEFFSEWHWSSVLCISQVDIIISEWMGYFLLYESMLDSVLWTRDRYLEVGGLMLPDFCRLYIAGLSDVEMHQQCCAFWDDVYGFKMSCMKSAVISEAEIAVVSSTKVITEPCLIKV